MHPSPPYQEVCVPYQRDDSGVSGEICESRLLAAGECVSNFEWHGLHLKKISARV
jgi:hypothetical protein